MSQTVFTAPAYTYVIADDYNAVDAALFDLHVGCCEETALTFIRIERNTGQLLYTLRWAEGQMFWAIGAQKIDGQRVKLFIALQPGHDILTPEGVLALFLNHRANQLKEEVSPPLLFGFEDSITDYFPASLKRPGRPASGINEWARQEIALGRDRGDVFAEYLRRHGTNLESKADVDRMRERFKQALRRTKVRNKE